MKNLTMKGEYTFRLFHPKQMRKLRHQYQNLSLTMKLKWKADIRKMKESLQHTGLFKPDGSVDIFKVAKRAHLKREAE